jgi:hypothetical protein
MLIVAWQEREKEPPPPDSTVTKVWGMVSTQSSILGEKELVF